jgi:hypothetical protein
MSGKAAGITRPVLGSCDGWCVNDKFIVSFVKGSGCLQILDIRTVSKFGLRVSSRDPHRFSEWHPFIVLLLIREVFHRQKKHAELELLRSFSLHRVQYVRQMGFLLDTPFMNINIIYSPEFLHSIYPLFLPVHFVEVVAAPQDRIAIN